MTRFVLAVAAIAAFISGVTAMVCGGVWAAVGALSGTVLTAMAFADVIHHATARPR